MRHEQGNETRLEIVEGIHALVQLIAIVIVVAKKAGERNNELFSTGALFEV